MKRLNLSGFTAAGVLVLALGGGVVGGLVASGSQQPVAPAAPVTLHQVAEESTPAPTGEPTATVEPTSAPTPTPEPPAAPVPDPVPVPDPAPKVEPVPPKTESPTEAADRARTEADRAEAEADRAEKVTEPAPAPPENAAQQLAALQKNGYPQAYRDESGAIVPGPKATPKP